ncbi:MAG: tetratricopeptide repeat protein [Bacteroidales bacterium]|nr:tetratricopeptide repeat protein [Bacteroidales bacterium]
MSLSVKQPRSWLHLPLLLLLPLPLLLNSCQNSRVETLHLALQSAQVSPSGVNNLYPAEGTIFPPEFPAPHITWEDTLHKVTTWHVFLSTSGNKQVFHDKVKFSAWKPDSAMWESLKQASANQPVYLTIVGVKKGFLNKGFSTGRVSFTFSDDSVGASLFYRAVPLPFGYAVKNLGEIEWYTGSVAGGEPRKILDNMPVCANCHSFSQNGLLAMDIDYANDKGSYIIAPLHDTLHLTQDKIITWSDYRREDGGATYGLLSQLSPDGRYVLSTVKDRSVFVPVNNLEYSQLFFPIKGIIAIYDRGKKQFSELPGADNSKYVQSNPNWSPGNDEILFCRANRYMSAKIEQSESVLLKLEDVQEFISGKKDFKFDIYRIPFNQGKGGNAIPVEGASNNNKSNFFARYSPDGKWIVFCQAENFMLLQPDSKLYIMPAGGGTPRLMNCNTQNMNSWHSWSPNGKWMVFSSKSKGPYTKLFLTHIDENGNDSPPVYLENLAFDNRAANIPEFYAHSTANVRKMVDDFSRNALYYNRLASLSIKENKYTDALKSIDEAIKTDSTYFDAFANRLVVNIVLESSGSLRDRHDKKIALGLIEKQIKEQPQDISLYIKRGELRLMMNDDAGALSDGLKAVKSNPRYYDACDLLSAVYQKIGKTDEAAGCLRKMLALQPDNTHVAYKLAILCQETGNPDPALELLNGIIERYANEARFYVARAGVYLKKGDKAAARADYDKAVSVDPENFIGYRERGGYFLNNGSPGLARKDFQQAIELLGKTLAENPQNAPLLVSRAELMEQTGDIEGALHEYERYLSNWPLNYNLLKKTAHRYYSAKQWPNAIIAYTSMVDNFPADAAVLCARGLAFQQSGNLPAALKDLNSAVAADVDEPAYYFFRSQVRKLQGDMPGCKTDLEKAGSLLSNIQRSRKLTKKEHNMLVAVQGQEQRQ